VTSLTPLGGGETGRADYQKISPTAKLVAALRRYSDIPFAPEVARAVDTDALIREMLHGEPLNQEVLQWMAPMMEARYKCLRSAIERSGAKQVVELASGFSFRGLAMTRDSGLKVVETDLPEVHQERVRLRESLERSAGIPHSPRLVFAPANLMSDSDVEALTAHLAPDQKLAVVHEGLFQYLSMEEKKEAALRIKKLLQRFGGVWLTPDFESRISPLTALWTNKQFMAIGMFLMSSTQRNMVSASFETDSQAMEFFTELGFKVKRLPQIDGSFTLSSVERVGTTPEQLQALREGRFLWELTV
jgi:O-methyltransferase involved in polyketide biosynthesis